MKLIQLKAKNFMPFKEQLSIDFPTDEARNIMLVLGDNMRGKTSLLNAIRWGLYGKAIGRHSRQIPLHLIANKDATLEDDWSIEVFLKFQEGENLYEVRRTADRRSHVATPSRNADFQTSVHLSKNGDLVSGADVESEINQAAPEQISRFFLFDGELLQEYEELLVEGSDQGRRIKDTIEQVLGVPSLTMGRDELKAMLRDAQKKQAQAMAQINSLKGAATDSERLTAELEAREEDLKQLSDKLGDTRVRRETLDEELEAAASLIALDERLKGAKNKVGELKALIDEKSDERRKVVSMAWRDMLGAKVAAKKASLLRRQEALQESSNEDAILNNRLKETQRLLATATCPTCQQQISDERRDYFARIVAELEEKVTRQIDASSDLRSVMTKLSKLDRVSRVEAKDRLQTLERELRTASVNLQKTENEIVELEDKIEGSDPAALTRKRLERDEKLREEGRLTEDIKQVKSDIQKTNEKLTVLQSRIRGMSGGRSERATAKVTLVSELHDVFDASIEHLRDQLRSTVEEKSSAAFRAMTTQSAYQGLKINENYGLSILDSAGREVSLRSAGAEQVVALSLIDGLNRTGRSTGPVIMDTPFGRLDMQHRDNILNYLPSVTSQFVLLVHSGEIRPETDLATVKDKIGAVYQISEVSETQSKIERASI
ncbi:AAA family ATPase [Rhodalgimonas zhirmunskyi]|uniref:AAA family ATPase n=1 Tax=Rhodalgimonas zhirmunskyi TaxID=2964767 RepID=A0AAJ1U3H4_9RHOB|nr:AAA family ATPase [Rhodoalgimonas zhirmunskyi]MDQ2092995.1 AAA family ATPase [Rhodoalgimonas zhirmunskyi]